MASTTSCGAVAVKRSDLTPSHVNHIRSEAHGKDFLGKYQRP